MRFKDRLWGLIKAIILISIIAGFVYYSFNKYEYENSAEHLLKVAQLTHQKINEQRRVAGLKELDWNENLEKIAIEHSKDMAQHNFVGHEGSSEPFEARFNRAGIYPPYAENCFFSENVFGDEELAEKAIQGWMSSYGHSANILNPEWTSEAIGVAKNGSKYYFTQDFK